MEFSDNKKNRKIFKLLSVLKHSFFTSLCINLQIVENTFLVIFSGHIEWHFIRNILLLLSGHITIKKTAMFLWRIINFRQLRWIPIQKRLPCLTQNCLSEKKLVWIYLNWFNYLNLGICAYILKINNNITVLYG